MKPHAIEIFFFEFENDFVETLRCIPMVVRYKLDTCGIKLKLPEWVKLSQVEKRELAYKPCYSPEEIAVYRLFVKELVHLHFGYEASPLLSVNDSWSDISEVPEEVQHKTNEWNCPRIALQGWISMNLLQRFALVKLSRSGHEGRNFPVALKEFGII
jgi:hypothetical protein